MTEWVDELRSAGLFAGIGDDLLERVAAVASVESLDPGDALVTEGTVGADLFIVRSGAFVATVEDQRGTAEIGRLGPGDVIGESRLVAGGRRTATVRALQPGEVLRIPAAQLDALMAASEPLRDALSEVIHRRLRDAALRLALSRALGTDAELLDLLCARAGWVRLRRAERLWEQGAAADGWYVLVSGELGVHVSAHGARREVGRVRRGEVFGEVALLRAEPRMASVDAVRESWLARFDERLLEDEIMTRNGALRALLHSFARRLSPAADAAVERARVIAVLPRDPGIDLDGFLRGLTAALGARGRVVDPHILRDEGVVSDAAVLPADHPGWLRFEGWVAARRRDAQYLLLVTDGGDDAWTRAAVAQADRVLLLVDADADRQRNAMERAVLDPAGEAGLAPVWLVLEQPADRALPTGTGPWLQVRALEHHAHYRRGRARDIARLARWLTGETTGIALSGGGARGFVHLGAVEAMFEAGNELDLIVGTSAGAMAGGLLARDEKPRDLAARGQAAIAAQGNPFAQFDLPLIALLRSHRLRDGLRQTFGDMAIEDSWIPLRVVATNLTQSRRIVFDRGPAWHRVFASSSPPGVMPPVQHGEWLLCDGGLVDNLPVSVLVQAGCRYKVASYVGSAGALPAPRNGVPGSGALLIDRLLRRRRYRDAPLLLATLLQCVSAPSAARLEAARASADLFFEPDLGAFSVTDFGAAQAMFETGLSHARRVLESASDDGSATTGRAD